MTFPLSTCLFVVCLAPQLLASAGTPDPAFEKVPFEQWMRGDDSAPIRWTARVPAPQLSHHQRLVAEFETEVDGVELEQRRGKGFLVTFVQVTDSEGNVFQNHDAINLEKVEEGVKGSDVFARQYAFILPGDYQVSMALYDSATREHWSKQEKLHVAPLKHDPLPELWHGLPPVQFIGEKDAPERWYLPAVQNRLNLTLEAKRQETVDVLVNLTPSEEESRAGQTRDNELRAILPALKVLTQSGRRNISLDVALLDLSRRRVTFQQKNLDDLDWPRMRESLGEADPNKIDVTSLKNRGREAQFFVSQVSRRIEKAESPDTGCAIIVMSAPVAFGSGEDREPIEVKDSACQVFYLRFHPPATRPVLLPPQREGRRGPPGWGIPRPVVNPLPRADELASTLKPLSPHLFDIETPDQFRKALAYIREKIGG